MTPDDARKAQQEADAALAKVRQKSLGWQSLADAWRVAREDNGFRAVLRKLAPGGNGG